MSRPVSWESCSRACLEGLGLTLYAVLRTSSCLAVIVVRGLFWLPSVSKTEDENKNEMFMQVFLQQIYVHCFKLENKGKKLPFEKLVAL